MYAIIANASTSTSNMHDKAMHAIKTGWYHTSPSMVEIEAVTPFLSTACEIANAFAAGRGSSFVVRTFCFDKGLGGYDHHTANGPELTLVEDTNAPDYDGVPADTRKGSQIN